MPLASHTRMTLMPGTWGISAQIARVNIQVQIGKKRKALELAFEQRSTELELVSK